MSFVHECDGRGLEQLRDAKKLENLSLLGSVATDQTLHTLRLLNAPGIDDAALLNLVVVKTLRELELVDASVSDQGLQHLRGVPQLQRLTLWLCPISNDGLSHIYGSSDASTSNSQALPPKASTA